MLTKREAAIISAYTGFLLGDFSDMHKYIKQIMKRSVWTVWTHDMGNKKVWEEIQATAKPDFVALEIET